MSLMCFYLMLYLSRGATWAGQDVEEQGRYQPKPPAQPKSDLIIQGSSWPFSHLSWNRVYIPNRINKWAEFVLHLLFDPPTNNNLTQSNLLNLIETLHGNSIKVDPF